MTQQPRTKKKRVFKEYSKYRILKHQFAKLKRPEPQTKKKVVKAWMLGTGGRIGYCIYRTKKACKEREKDLPFADIPIIPCTITYTLPTRPHKQ